MTNRILFAILILLFAAGTALSHAPAVDDGGSLFTTTEEASLLTGNVLDNDIGTTKSVQSFDTTGTIGLVTDNGDGTFLYDPNGQFNHLNNGENATDSFTYVLWDGGAPDIATVTMTITGVSPPPSGVFAEFAATVQPGEFKIIPNSSPYQHFSWPATVEAEIGPDAIELCARINCNVAHGQMDIYPGMAWDIENEIGWLPNNGGHGNSFQGSGVMRYVFGQSWERLTHPTRLYTKAEADADPQNGYLADRDGDGTNDDCLNFLDGNQAVHYYDGFTRIPGSNKIVMGGVTAMCWQETTQAQTAPWVVWTFDTATLKTERLPLLDPWNNYSTSAFSETVQHPGKAPGALYWKGNNNFVVVVATNWDDTSTWEVIQEVNHSNPLPIGYGSMQVMGDKLLFNHQYHLNSYTISPDGIVDYTTRAELINFSDNWPAGWSSYFAARGVAPAGDKVVFWDGRHRIEIYDTINNTRTFLPQTCNPAQRTSTGTFSMWEYLPKHDVFIGAASSTDGVVLYRLPGTYTEGQNDWNMEDQLDCTPFIPAPEVPPEQQTLLYHDNFEDPPFIINGEGNRCMGTVDELHQEDCYYNDWRWTTNSDRNGDNTSGPHLIDGALRFPIPEFAWPGHAGYMQIDVTRWFRPLKKGDSVKVTYRWRGSDTLFNGRFRTKDGAPTGPKLSIFGEMDTEGELPTGSCSNIETVMHGGFARTIHPDPPKGMVLGGYHACGWYEGFTENLNTPEHPPDMREHIWDTQPGGDVFCPGYISFGDRAVPGNVADTCFFLVPNKWITIEQVLHIGPWQRDRTGEKKSRIEVWATVDGKRVQVFGHDLYLAQPEYEDSGFLKLWLLPYMTGKDPNQQNPEAWVEYDDVTVELLAPLFR